MSKPSRVVIYTRVSTDEQAEEGHSLEAQLKICTAYAESRGWQVVDHFEDAGYSGSTDARPGFRRVMHAARRGTCDVVITHKLDRFSRNIVHILTHLRELNDLGVAYASASEDFDFTTPIGKVVLAILAAFAEWYLDNLSQETTKGKRARAEAGLWNGDPPFGYTHIDGAPWRSTPKPHQALCWHTRNMQPALSPTHRSPTCSTNKATGPRANVMARAPGARMPCAACSPTAFISAWSNTKMPPTQASIPPLLQRLIQQSGNAPKAQILRQPRQDAHSHSRLPCVRLLVCEECGTRPRGHWMRGERNYQDPGRTEYATGCTQTRIINAQVVEERLGELLSATVLPTNWREEILARQNSADRPR